MHHSATLPPVDFNHLYIVIDDKTYRAIQASDFLRGAFSGMEQRATRTAAGERWYGTYFYTSENYLEFFGETTSRHWNSAARAGWGGIAFSTDIAGGAQAIARQIEQEYAYSPHFHLRQLATPEKTVDWFYNLRLAETLAGDSFDSWLMEYHPQIFAHKGIPYLPETSPARQVYLSPWNRTDGLDAAGRPRAMQPVFQRITGATIHLERENAARYASILNTLGFETRPSPEEILAKGRGFSLAIRLHERLAPGAYHVSSLQMEMRRQSVAPMTFVFAPGARLELREDGTAEWSFSRPA